MADFFKGLSGGFQSGLQLGEAMRAKQEREALAQIMQEKPVAAGPDFAGQFRMQGLEQGPMPQAEPIQDTQSFMGQQYAQSALTPDKVAGLRYGAMADVIAQRDPAAALRMRQEQTRMQREAELAPLQKKALETQVEAGKLGLTSAQQQIARGDREAATAKRMDDFNAWRSQNPQADFAAINAEVQRLGMGVDEQFKVASSLTGIGEQEFKASQQRIQKLVKNQGLDGLLKAHKESNDLDPGSHFEVIRGKGGVVSLNRVDTATGKVIQPNVFSGSEAETAAYLNKAAMDPATIIDYTMNLEKGKAAIAASKASTAKDTAMAGLYNQGGAGAGKGTLKQKVADFKEVYGRDPTEAEKGVLAGLTNKPREFTAADVNARAKLMIDGGMMDPDDATKPLSPQKAIQMAQSELSGVPYVSPVDQLILDMAAARNPKAGGQPAPAPNAPAATPAAAPRGSSVLGPDPNRPQPGVSPVTGLSRETPVQAPNLIAAAGRGLDAGQARYKAYLESKIANRQPLTADERIRAQRFGLQ
jgi:hypothetical protein